MQELWCGMRLPPTLFCFTIVFASLDGEIGEKLGATRGSQVRLGWLLTASHDTRGIALIHKVAVSYLSG